MAAKAEKKAPVEEADAEAERAVEQWKVKQLIKNLEAARGYVGHHNKEERRL
jgi:hypothetical protein